MFIQTIIENYLNTNLIIKFYLDDMTYGKTRVVGRDVRGAVHYISQHDTRELAKNSLDVLMKKLNTQTQNIDARVEVM